jgi:hypothetical protein
MKWPGAVVERVSLLPDVDAVIHAAIDRNI